MSIIALHIFNFDTKGVQNHALKREQLHNRQHQTKIACPLQNCVMYLRFFIRPGGCSSGLGCSGLMSHSGWLNRRVGGIETVKQIICITAVLYGISTQYPLHQYTIAPLHQYTTTPLHQYTTTPIHHYTITPLHHYTTTPLHHYTITPIHHYTSSLAYCVHSLLFRFL